MKTFNTSTLNSKRVFFTDLTENASHIKAEDYSIIYKSESRMSSISGPCFENIGIFRLIRLGYYYPMISDLSCPKVKFIVKVYKNRVLYVIGQSK